MVEYVTEFNDELSCNSVTKIYSPNHIEWTTWEQTGQDGTGALHLMIEATETYLHPAMFKLLYFYQSYTKKTLSQWRSLEAQYFI